MKWYADIKKNGSFKSLKVQVKIIADKRTKTTEQEVNKHLKGDF